MPLGQAFFDKRIEILRPFFGSGDGQYPAVFDFKFVGVATLFNVLPRGGNLLTELGVTLLLQVIGFKKKMIILGIRGLPWVFHGKKCIRSERPPCSR